MEVVDQWYCIDILFSRVIKVGRRQSLKHFACESLRISKILLFNYVHTCMKRPVIKLDNIRAQACFQRAPWKP